MKILSIILVILTSVLIPFSMDKEILGDWRIISAKDSEGHIKESATLGNKIVCYKKNGLLEIKINDEMPKVIKRTSWAINSDTLIWHGENGHMTKSLIQRLKNDTLVTYSFANNVTFTWIKNTPNIK